MSVDSLQMQQAGPQPGSPLSPMARQQLDFHGSMRLPALRAGSASSGGDSPPPSRGVRSPGSAAPRSLNALLLGSPVRSGGTETAFSQVSHSRASTPGSLPLVAQEPESHHQHVHHHHHHQQQRQRQAPPHGERLAEAPTVSSLSLEVQDPAAIRAAAAELAERHIAEALAAEQRQAAEAAARERPESDGLSLHSDQHQHHQPASHSEQPPGALAYQPAAASAAAKQQLHASSAPQPDNVLALKLTVVSGPSTDASYTTAKDTRQASPQFAGNPAVHHRDAWVVSNRTREHVMMLVFWSCRW
jgi:hypothetical protein